MEISESIGVLEILGFVALALVVGWFVWWIFISIKEIRDKEIKEQHKEMSWCTAAKHLALKFWYEYDVVILFFFVLIPLMILAGYGLAILIGCLF